MVVLRAWCVRVCSCFQGLTAANPTLWKRHVDSQKTNKLTHSAGAYTLSVAGISNLETSIVQPKFFRTKVRDDDDDFAFGRRIRKTPAKLFGGSLLGNRSQVHDLVGGCTLLALGCHCMVCLACA